jgi:hypothetical protein
LQILDYKLQISDYKFQIRRLIKKLSMAKIKQFEDLEIWKEATDIAINIYKISEEGKLALCIAKG